MVVAEVSVVPLGTSSASVSGYVADCVSVVKESGLKYEVTAMGTILEGELEEVLAVTRRMHDIPFDAGAQRVVTTVKIDERRDKELTIKSKVEAVALRLGETQVQGPTCDGRR
ncbi:MAG: MTH1187 family thiamine-binding protein [Bacillota bacterium]